MPDGEKTRRLGGDKIAFLIMLILGLLLARLLIVSKNNFKLSESIGLKGTGLEVSMPTSNGWKPLSNDFVYQENEFQLASQMQISSDSVITAVWRYTMVPTNVDPNERFGQLATVLQGHIASKATQKFGQFTYDWAKIESKDTILFVGSTVLPNQRTLTLEVGQKGVGDELAEKIFKALLATARYNTDNSFARGLDLLNKFKTSFLPQIEQTDLSAQNQSDYFRIKDAAGNSIGFKTDALSYTAEPNDNYPLSSASLFFFSPSFNTVAEQSLFRSDVNLSAFDWMVKEGNLLANRQTTTHMLLQNKIVTIDISGKVNQIPFTNIMIPESLFEMVVADFLESDYETIYMEVLLSNGRVSSVILSRIKSSETAALPERSACQADFFGGFTALHKMFYDGRGRMVSAEIQGNIPYRIERTTRAEIFEDFPQWLNKMQQIEQYQNKKRNKDDHKDVRK